jgi:predicted regulator of Ras-like GTPase activity (Roadblock/LC7/MglB family)
MTTMTTRLSDVLHQLRAVTGVLGSFVWAHDGTLIAADLVPARSEAVLMAVAARLQRLVEAYCNVGEQLECLTLGLQGCRVHVSGVANASVAVLVASSVQLPALRLTVARVLRELGQLPELSAFMPPVTTTVAAEPTALPSPRLYRGQRIGQ